VIRELKLLGSPAPIVREHTLAKTGPVQTDQSFYIIDAPFKQLQNSQEVDDLARSIKAIEGVLEVGLFHGKNGIQTMREGGQGGQKPVAVYFGKQDGEVLIRKSPELVEVEKEEAAKRA
jgi:ribose 5-phosphate isomerase A